MKEVNNENLIGKNQNKENIFQGRFPKSIFVLILVGLVSLVLSFFSYLAFFVFIAFIVVVIAILAGIEMLGILIKSEFTIKRFVTTLIMIYYFYCSLILFIILIQRRGMGGYWLVLVVIPAITYDLVGFWVGKKKGRKKITKRISPGKTLRGTLAGYSTSFVSVVIILVIAFPHLELWQMLLVSFLLPLLAFLGDLIESGYKRVMGVKDSGIIFKRHGGVLDRTDSFPLPIYGICFLAIWFL